MPVYAQVSTFLKPFPWAGTASASPTSPVLFLPPAVTAIAASGCGDPCTILAFTGAAALRLCPALSATLPNPRADRPPAPGRDHARCLRLPPGCHPAQWAHPAHRLRPPTLPARREQPTGPESFEQITPGHFPQAAGQVALPLQLGLTTARPDR